MLRIGTAGWTLPAETRDRFPEGPSHLARYASVFTCAEINSSFHRPHRPSTYERWAATVPSDFRFSLKLPKTITHTKRCADCYDDLVRFIDESSPLGEKRSVLLVQLPPTFAFDDALMEQFFSDLRSLYQGFVVCEPRHATWFAPDAEQLMEHFRIARVAADPAPASTDANTGGWNGIAYFRWHGAPRIYYSRYEEAAIASLATQVREHPAPERWVIFDNTAAGAAAGNALDLIQRCAD